MQSLLKPRTLNQSLGWLLAAVVLPLLAGALGLLALQADQEQDAAQARLAVLAQTLVQTSDAEFERSRAQLEVLAASPLVDSGDWEGMYRYARSVTERTPGSLIVLVGPDGQVLFNTAAVWGQPLPNLWKLGNQSREIEWNGRKLPLSSGHLSLHAFESGWPIYSDLYYGVQILKPSLSVSIPVKRDGRSRYALIFAYPPELLQDRFATAVRLPGIRAVLVDRLGLVVASNAAAASRLADRVRPIEPGGPDDEASGIFRQVSRDGTPLVGAWARSPLNGFVVRVAQPEDGSVITAERTASLAWVAMLLTALLVSLLLASLVSRKLAQPLKALGDDVLAGRAPPPERDTGIAEIDLLAQALRHGAESERQRAQEATLRSIAQDREAMLRQADRQKDEFLATLAHELRNPLAPIRTAVELIRLRNPSDPAIERARAIIARQAQHLTRLVDDLLDVSRITLGRIHLRDERVDLGEIAHAAAEAIGEAAGRANLQVAQDIARPAPQVRGDATRLTQCLTNLLNNAVKFTAPGGHVLLRVWTDDGMAHVEVTDSGIGIAPDNLDRVFELFVQERHSGHGGNTGLGIGLALTRRLVELHGGRIHARSDGPGRGSSFCISLPLAGVMEAPPEADTQDPKAATGDRLGARVLVVDDNRDAADTLADVLGLHGYLVTRAHDGASALQAVAQARPDVVLLDIGLPDVDGYEVCRRIRAQAGAGAAPVLVAVTGWGQQADRDAAREAGFDAHMTKPVAPDQLLQVLRDKLPA
jgi:signal transduction histidine kinase/CheY-like chemotaxis protein